MANILKTITIFVHLIRENFIVWQIFASSMYIIYFKLTIYDFCFVFALGLWACSKKQRIPEYCKSIGTFIYCTTKTIH